MCWFIEWRHGPSRVPSGVFPPHCEWADRPELFRALLWYYLISGEHVFPENSPKSFKLSLSFGLVKTKINEAAAASSPQRHIPGKQGRALYCAFHYRFNYTARVNLFLMRWQGNVTTCKDIIRRIKASICAFPERATKTQRGIQS